MKVRGILSVVTVISVLFMSSFQDLCAADAMNQVQAARTHAISSAALHQTVQLSHQQASEARKSVQAFLSRDEVRTQIQRLGLAPEKLMTQVSMLSDNDLARLQKQIMSVDLQKETAGLSGAAIALIVIAGVAGLAILIWLAAREADEHGYYYY